jgi:hypothetical protein
LGGYRPAAASLGGDPVATGSLGPVLDHVFMGAVASLGRTLDDAFLARVPHEDRLAVDVVTGDLLWETSVSLPGEGEPPRVRADLTLEWSTWSQAAWRSWVLDEPVDEYPEINFEVVLRLQRLAARPPVADVLARLGDGKPPGAEPWERVGVTVEEDFDSGHSALEVAFEGVYRLSDPEDAPRRGLFGRGGELGDGPGRHPGSSAGPDREAPGRRPPARPGTDPAGPPTVPSWPGHPSPGDQVRAPAAGESPLAAHLDGLGRWLASTLVRLADMDIGFLPPGDD